MKVFFKFFLVATMITSLYSTLCADSTLHIELTPRCSSCNKLQSHRSATIEFNDDQVIRLKEQALVDIQNFDETQESNPVNLIKNDDKCLPISMPISLERKLCQYVYYDSKMTAEKRHASIRQTFYNFFIQEINQLPEDLVVSFTPNTNNYALYCGITSAATALISMVISKKFTAHTVKNAIKEATRPLRTEKQALRDEIEVLKKVKRHSQKAINAVKRTI